MPSEGGASWRCASLGSRHDAAAGPSHLSGLASFKRTLHDVAQLFSLHTHGAADLKEGGNGRTQSDHVRLQAGARPGVAAAMLLPVLPLWLSRPTSCGIQGGGTGWEGAKGGGLPSGRGGQGGGLP